jgi:hypothetical protein
VITRKAASPPPASIIRGMIGEIMNIYIGIPLFAQADAEFISSLSKTKEVFKALGHEVEIDFHTGCAVISKARNEIVARFISSGFDKLLFIDADMVWNAVDAAKLIDSKHDFCGIAYRQKSEETKYNAVLNDTEQEGWLGAERIGTGFMCLTRRCLIDMAMEYPETRYLNDGHAYYALFDFELREGQYWGEDYTFCRRWKETGGSIWVMPAEIGHIGKFVYLGNIKDTL